MRFKRFTFNLRSPLFGVHVGRNPVSGQGFVHVAFFPFFGIDLELKPYGINEEARARLETTAGLLPASVVGALIHTRVRSHPDATPDGFKIARSLGWIIGVNPTLSETGERALQLLAPEEEPAPVTQIHRSK